MPDTPSSKSAITLFSGKLPFWAYGFCLHVISGFIATAAHYTVMFVLIRVGMTGLLASTLGFGAGAITRFLLSYFHVFSPTSDVRLVMFRFVLALLIQMVANSLLLGTLMVAGLQVWEAQIVTTAALTIFTYIGGKFWVFR
jgi:putative flippase GtrA